MKFKKHFPNTEYVVQHDSEKYLLPIGEKQYDENNLQYKKDKDDVYVFWFYDKNDILLGEGRFHKFQLIL